MNTTRETKSVSFKAQARTIDHLGKGQIADAPTAISELWKNSYDAYAQDVALHLYDGNVKCGAIIDNGCGMSFEQLSNSWLTVGTASKTKKQTLPEEDRFNLPVRFTQGEKGIGRLSSAFLSPVTLVVTKKVSTNFSAALIDWRQFENTYLSLQDIKIPMAEFSSLNDLPIVCRNLQDELINNLTPITLDENDSYEQADNLYINKSWDNYSIDELEEYKSKFKDKDENDFLSTKEKIIKLSKDFYFDEKFLEPWEDILKKNTQKESDYHGTALFLLDLNRDLSLLTNRDGLGRDSEEYLSIEDSLVETLRAFVDPFNRGADNDEIYFQYRIIAHDKEFNKNSGVREVLNYKEVFDYNAFSKLEHKIEGYIDEKGWFRGGVTAFGVKYENIEIPCRVSGMDLITQTGRFDLKIGTFELERAKSTHKEAEHDFLLESAIKYSGFLIFRDGLRVLPYGRSNNDFFQIEERRGKNAGRYYWASRRLFGNVSLNQIDNYRLKDKAGREGFIINQAARELKSLVTVLLITLADRFFGTKSDNRQVMLEALSKLRTKQKRAQKASIKANVKSFKETLENNEFTLEKWVNELHGLYSELNRDIEISFNQLKNILNKIEIIDNVKNELKIPVKPAKISDPLEFKYRDYKDSFSEFSELLLTCKEKINILEVKGNFLTPIQSAENKFKQSDKNISKTINKYAGDIESNLNRLKLIWAEQAKEDKKSFEIEALPILDSVTQKSDIVSILNKIDLIYLNLNEDINLKYSSFLQAIDKLESGIDLDAAFHIAEEERSIAEDEINKIRNLAQLGISFEVLAHELNAQDQSVTRALNSMTNDAKQQIGFQNAIKAHRQFTEYLRFLTPLKLSGYQAREKITGQDILDNIRVFFRDRFEKQNINFIVTDKFRTMTVTDVKSRIIPVFINIINNAIYWVSLSEDRRIVIDVLNGLVVIANSGPSVHEDDVPRLFELFYSRRSQGNGVGLYLSRQNLSVAYHKIWYAVNIEEKIINDGANFVIQFRGMELKK